MTSLGAELSPQYRSWIKKRLPAINMRTLRLLTVILPVTLLIAVDYARHFIFPFALHDTPGFMFMWGGALFGAIVFSFVVFGTIERMQKEILQRNRELFLLYEAAYHQAEQLGALREAGMALTAELSLDAVLQKVVDLSRDLVGARYGSLAVLDEENRIERLITSGLSPEARERITEFPKGLGVMAVMPGDIRPVRLADIRKHPLSVGYPPFHPPMATLLGVPIASKGRIIGNLKLTNKRGGGEFTQEDEDRVVMLAAQAAIAIENAKLYEQEQALAILEERERIAQDLHDGIIQNIYAIGLNLEQCIEQAGANSRDLSSRLSRAVDALNGIIKDVRNYIFALQPTDLRDQSLRGGLEILAREFQINSLVDADLVVQGEIEGLLGHDQVGHFFQITREALTNTLKHARATSVTIGVERLTDSLELTISDNGCGFAPKVIPTGRGLRNMVERARCLGASFIVDSEPDRGTTLIIRMPLAMEEEEKNA